MNQITTQQQQLSEEEKQRLIVDAQRDIQDIISQFQNKDSLISKLWRTERKEIINFWAERLELIYKLTDKAINTIANQITKELQRMKLVDDDYLYAYQVLPACYKGHNPNPSDDFAQRSDNTSKPLDCKVENARLIKTFKEAGELLIDYSHELEEIHLWSLLNDQGKLDEEEDLGYIEAATAHLLAVRDRRTDIPPRHTLSFYATFGGATENEAAKRHFIDVRAVEEVSGKQSHNKLYGLTTDVPYIYEPEDDVLAYKDQFVGAQCRDPRSKGCESYRVKVYYNKWKKRDMYYCHKCKEWFHIPKLLLPGPSDRLKRSTQLNYVNTVDVAIQSPFTASTTVNPDLGFTATTTAVTKL